VGGWRDRLLLFYFENIMYKRKRYDVRRMIKEGINDKDEMVDE
jgi:hypothetical protein